MRKRHIILVSVFLILAILLSFNAGRIYEAISSNGQQDVGKQHIVFSGSIFPDEPSEGQLFFHTVLDKVYAYKNGDWAGIYDSQDVSLQGPASYTVFTNGTHTFMKNETIGTIDSLSADSATIFNYCFGNLTNGGLVWLREGLYEIGTMLDVALPNIDLVGSHGTILKMKDGANLEAILKVSGNGHHISHLQLDRNKANNPTSGVGIYVYCARKTHLETLWIRDCREQGIKMTGTAAEPSNSGMLRYIYVEDCVKEGIYFGVYASDEIINSVWITGCIDAGIKFDAGGSFLTNFHLTGISGHALKIYNSYIRVVNGFVENNQQDGIRVYQGSHNTIEGVTLWRNGQSSHNTYSSIYLYDARNNTVTDCVILEDAATRTKYGIAEYGSADDNSISDNRVFGPASAPIQVAGSATEVNHNRGYRTESLINFSGIANGSYVLHELAGDPQNNVVVSLAIQGYAWKGASNSSHIQIFGNVATLTGSAYCQYKP